MVWSKTSAFIQSGWCLSKVITWNTTLKQNITMWNCLIYSHPVLTCNITWSWCLRLKCRHWDTDRMTKGQDKRHSMMLPFFLVLSWHSNMRTRLSNRQYTSLFKHVYTGRPFTLTGDQGRDVYNNRMCRLITSSLFHWQENRLLSDEPVG